MRQIDKLPQWIEAEVADPDLIEGMEALDGFITRQTLYLSTEYEKGDTQFPVMKRYDFYPGLSAEIALTLGNTSFAIPQIALLLPGLCGHYSCGTPSTFVLN